jgi:hypothetical protein
MLSNSYSESTTPTSISLQPSFNRFNLSHSTLRNITHLYRRHLNVCHNGPLFITKLCWISSIVFGLFKTYDVSEAGFAPVIRCKEGKESYSAATVR